MKKWKVINKAGPYRADSCADGTIKITPTWSQFPKWNEQDGGGPGLGSRWEVAAEIEKLLNELAIKE